MANTSVTFRMDENLKKQFESVLDELGLNLTTGINVFAKAVVRDNGIPFELKADPFYSEANQAHLRSVITELEAGQGRPHELIEVDDA
ncbi:hypothetical protein SDC9_125393 [bioreactor metagenome]|uniref:Antitoxin DinJ n=1 Tax=bioreactor metagenome TaxID=1076179 RepID=A0A645CNN4_9ZZZZ